MLITFVTYILLSVFPSVVTLVPTACHCCASAVSQLCQALGTECDKHCYAIDTTFRPAMNSRTTVAMMIDFGSRLVAPWLIMPSCCGRLVGLIVIFHLIGFGLDAPIDWIYRN